MCLSHNACKCCICVSRLLASTTNSAQQWVAKICAVRTVNFTTSLLQVLKRPRLHSPRGSSLSAQTLDIYSSWLHTSLKNIYEEAKKKHYLLKVYYNISDSPALKNHLESFSRKCQNSNLSDAVADKAEC